MAKIYDVERKRFTRFSEKHLKCEERSQERFVDNRRQLLQVDRYIFKKVQTQSEAIGIELEMKENFQDVVPSKC